MRIVLIIISVLVFCSHAKCHDLTFEKKDSINHAILKIDREQKILSNNIDELKTCYAEDKKNMWNNSITYIGLIFGFASLMFSLFLAIIAFLSFKKYRDLDKEIRKKLGKMVKYQNRLKELEENQRLNLNYIETSLDIFSEYFERLSKSRLTMEYIAIRKTYHRQSKVRFNGLSELLALGTENSLPHIERILKLKDEIPQNIIIANKALKSITTRIKENKDS